MHKYVICGTIEFRAVFRIVRLNRRQIRNKVNDAQDETERMERTMEK